MSRKGKNVQRDKTIQLYEPLDAIEPTVKACLEKYLGVGGSEYFQDLELILENLSILKFIFLSKKVGYSIRDRHHAKRLTYFAFELLNYDHDAVKVFLALDPEEKESILDFIDEQILQHSNAIESQAFGLLTKAYFDGNISRDTLMSLAHGIKLVNPSIYTSENRLRVYDGDSTDFVDGAITLLPNLFILQIQGYDKANYIFTKLGKDFFTFVYKPLSERLG